MDSLMAAEDDVYCIYGFMDGKSGRRVRHLLGHR